MQALPIRLRKDGPSQSDVHTDGPGTIGPVCTFSPGPGFKTCPKCGGDPSTHMAPPSIAQLEKDRAVAQPLRCPKCGSTDTGLLPPDFETLKCHACERNSPFIKAAISVAGLCVKAIDTGRVLLIERGVDPNDPASECFEFPGGHLNPGESPADAALREWAEEVGVHPPPGYFLSTWTHGIYRGFIYLTATETISPEHWHAHSNPDNPDGDVVESAMWVDPRAARSFTDLRAELKGDTALWDQIERAGTPYALLPISLYKEAAGHPFRGNQYTGGVASAQMGSNSELERHAHAYSNSIGLSRPTDIDYSKVKVDTPTAKSIARAYDALPKRDPEASPAFAQMAKEIEQQYAYLTGPMGIKVDVTREDPYATVQEMQHDVTQNHHISVLSTALTGHHPYFTDEQNDHFRAVHDTFGHAATGRGFDRHGEEAAWLSHSLMFSPLARRAMTTETRGQNSVLTQERHGFPEQKVALLPDKFSTIPNSIIRKMMRKALVAQSTLRHCIAGRAQLDRMQWQPPFAKGFFPFLKLGNVTWDEQKHPRGQPTNAGEFASDPGGGSKKPKGIGRKTMGSATPVTDDDVPGDNIQNHEGTATLNEAMQDQEAKAGGSGQAKAQVAHLVSADMVDNWGDRFDANFMRSRSISPEDLKIPGALVVKNLNDGSVNVWKPSKHTGGIGSFSISFNERKQAVPANSPEALTAIREGGVSSLISLWAGSSNDSSDKSLAIQDAAIAEFGLKNTSEWTEYRNPDSVKEEFDKNGDMYRAFLRSQYNVTQKDLAARGVTTVMLERGVKDDPETNDAEDNGDGTATVKMRPLSSWSVNPDTAENSFGSGGTTYRAEFPANRILSTTLTGFGCLGESEVVPLGDQETVGLVGGQWNGESQSSINEEWASNGPQQEWADNITEGSDETYSEDDLSSMWAEEMESQNSDAVAAWLSGQDDIENLTTKQEWAESYTSDYDAASAEGPVTSEELDDGWTGHVDDENVDTLNQFLGPHPEAKDWTLQWAKTQGAGFFNYAGPTVGVLIDPKLIGDGVMLNAGELDKAWENHLEGLDKLNEGPSADQDQGQKPSLPGMAQFAGPTGGNTYKPVGPGVLPLGLKLGKPTPSKDGPKLLDVGQDKFLNADDQPPSFGIGWQKIGPHKYKAASGVIATQDPKTKKWSEE